MISRDVAHFCLETAAFQYCFSVLFRPSAVTLNVIIPVDHRVAMTSRDAAHFHLEMPDFHYHRFCFMLRLACVCRGHMEASTAQPATVGLGWYLPLFEALWGLFGKSARLVYGSNWPVCDRALPVHEWEQVRLKALFVLFCSVSALFMYCSYCFCAVSTLFGTVFKLFLC